MASYMGTLLMKKPSSANCSGAYPLVCCSAGAKSTGHGRKRVPGIGFSGDNPVGKTYSKLFRVTPGCDL